MPLKTHKIAQKNNSIKIYSRLQPKEITILFIVFPYLLLMFLLIGYIRMTIFNVENFWDISVIITLIVAIGLLVIPFFILKNFIIDIRRKIFPILIIEPNSIRLTDINGKVHQVARNEIREILAEATSYNWNATQRKIEAAKFSIIVLKYGKITIDIINSKYLLKQSQDILKKDIKERSKAIGKYLGELLNAPYVWKN